MEVGAMVDVNNASYQGMLKKRPLNVQILFGNEPVGLVSGRDIATAVKEMGATVLAANVRNPLVLKGVMRAAKKCDAAVLFEIAKSEATYCATNFETLPEYALKASAELGHGVLFGLHVDHYAIKSDLDVLKAIPHLWHILEHGFTSVAIDASHLPDWENFCATRDIGTYLPSCLGLEVEVGEIKGPGELTTVEEALFFIGGLNSWGIFPDYLAISNGSLHGTYDASKGQREGIDLQRTLEVAEAIKPYGVSIAQHGISGTPLHKVSEFRKYGINKGNVATLWQNIIFGMKMDPETGNAIIEQGSYVKESERGIPDELWDRIVTWADGQGYSRSSGEYKKTNLPFNEEILALPPKRLEPIIEEIEYWAERFFKAFNAIGTAEKVLEVISRRDHSNAAPEREILHKRAEFTREKTPAPDRKKDSGSTPDE